MYRAIICNYYLVLLLLVAACTIKQPASIYVSENGSKEEKLAAQEIRKYIYQRTNELLPLVEFKEGDLVKADAIVVGVAGNTIMKATGFTFPVLGADAFILKTITTPSGKQLLVSGGSPIGTLYAAYHLAEQLGVGFYLDGDVIPDRQIPFVFPELDNTQTPLFDRRGIQPFHDFPEGPDWWNTADYKAIFSQLVKLKMNFFGLHTYPEGGVGPEPLTWIGLPEDVNPDGTVKTAYHSRHFNTLGGTFGYFPRKTTEYSFGTGLLFDREDFGADYMRNRTPWPKPEDEANLFNDMGRMLADALPFAGGLGIKSCIGTEIPLVLPNQFIELLKKRGLDPESPQVRQRIYEGIFLRIKLTHPLDFYWFWTSENWTWNGETKEELQKTIRDFDAANKALEVVKPGFKLATCGWVLGPKSDRALFDKYLPKSVAFSCINRNLGWEPVDPAFVRINDREKWAIPWMEDDPGLIIPQFWVGRMRRDAADAYAYSCSGYFGIHWRTRVLSMNVSSLAQAAWEQPWNPEKGKRITPDMLDQYLNTMEGKERKTRDMECLDFYQNWCKIQFGESVSESMAQLFTSLDGMKEKTTKLESGLTRLPRPATWIDGPGNVLVNLQPWDSVQTQYNFIDKMERLRPSVLGNGNLERFDYWLNQFKYLKATGKLACTLGLYKNAVKTLDKTEQGQKNSFANEKLLPILRQEVDNLSDIFKYLISTVTTWGEFGNVTNWQQHVIPHQIQPQINQIVKLTGDSSWVTDLFPKSMKEVNKIIVPSPQTMIQKGKDYTVKVVTYNLNPKEAILYWRILGQKDFQKSDLTKTTDNYLLATIPASQISDDFEYYITVADAKEYFFPASAPRVNFAVVRL